MKVNNIQDWLDSHIGGDCNEASDCLIMLAQVIQKEVTDLASENKTLRELAQGNSKSEDTSLDDIFAPLIDSPNLTLTSVYWYEAKQSILAWHKAEIAKLFDQIRSEVNSMYELSITDLELRQHQQGVEIPVLGKTELLEALTRLEQK